MLSCSPRFRSEALASRGPQECGKLREHAFKDSRLHALSENLDCGRVVGAINRTPHQFLDFLFPQQS